MNEIEQRISDGRIPWSTLTKRKGYEEVWTPSSIVPHTAHGAIAKEMASLSREIRIVLIGDTLTEEALPTYTHFLTSIEGMPDPHDSSLQQWIRAWSAEEERHGTLLDRILFMSEAVDMGAYERSKHMLIDDGMQIGTENDPYSSFYYTAFQERATQVSHANVAKIATDCNAPLIAKACRTIAGDEGMHAIMYSNFVKTALEIDPNGMIETIRDMMKNRVVMPAHLMREVRSDTHEVTQAGPAFSAFSDTAQQVGVYTTKDYDRISGKLLTEWDLAHTDDHDVWQVSERSDLSEDGREALAMCVRIQNIIHKKATNFVAPELPDHEFSWVLN